MICSVKCAVGRVMRAEYLSYHVTDERAQAVDPLYRHSQSIKSTEPTC